MFTEAIAARQFLLAGKAIVTLRSQRSGKHYTYQVNKFQKSGVELPERYFVKLLVEPNRYAYLGTIDRPTFDYLAGLRFRLTIKSKYKEDSLPFRAFQYFFCHLMVNKIAPELEVRHSGTCGRCRRELTHPTSLDRGIGPECWKFI